MFCTPKAADIVAVNAETGKELEFRERRILIDELWEAARYIEQHGISDLLHRPSAVKADELLRSLTLSRCPNVKFHLRSSLLDLH